MQFTMKTDEGTFFEVLENVAEQPFDAMELLYPREVPVFEKYDEFVPPELIRKGFAYSVLDIDGMLERVKEWAKYVPGRLEDGRN